MFIEKICESVLRIKMNNTKFGLQIIYTYISYRILISNLSKNLFAFTGGWCDW